MSDTKRISANAKLPFISDSKPLLYSRSTLEMDTFFKLFSRDRCPRLLAGGRRRWEAQNGEMGSCYTFKVGKSPPWEAFLSCWAHLFCSFFFCRYNLTSKTWLTLDPSVNTVTPRYGHSLALHEVREAMGGAVHQNNTQSLHFIPTLCKHLLFLPTYPQYDVKMVSKIIFDNYIERKH